HLARRRQRGAAAGRPRALRLRPQLAQGPALQRQARRGRVTVARAPRAAPRPAAARPAPRRRPKAQGGDDFDGRVLDGRKETLSYRVADGEQGLRLDQWLAKRLSWRSRSSVVRLLDDGLVQLSGRSARANRRVAVGDIVTVQLPRPLR